MRALPGVLLAALLVPGGALAASVTGDLRFEDGVALRGDVDVEAAFGVLDLAPALADGDAFTISWTSARVHVLTSTRDRYANAAWSEDARGNETFSWKAGKLSGFSCAQECKAFLYARPGGAVGLSGFVDGPLRHVARETSYWTGWQGEGVEATFYYPVPAGWLNVSGARDAADATLVHDALPRAEGSLGLILWNATADLHAADRRERVWTGTTTSPMEGPLGVGLGTRSERRSLMIELEGARLDAAPGSGVLLLAPEADVSLAGGLSAKAARGTLVVDGEPRALAGKSLRLDGDLDLGARFDPPGAPAALGGEHVARSRVDGEASRVVVGGDTIASTGPSASIVATGAAVVLLLLGAAALYTRLARTSLLTNPNRQVVYDAVKAVPGTHVLEIARRTRLAEGVVRHHLRKLQDHGFVVEREDGGRRRSYFALDRPADAETQDVVLTLKDETRRRVVMTISSAPEPLSQQQVAERVGISARLACYHIARLEEAGLVASAGSMPRRYAASPRLVSFLTTR